MKRGKTKRDLERAVVRAAVRWDEIKLLRFAIAADEELHKEIVAVLREAERVDEDDDPWSAFCAVCHRRVDDGGVVPRAQHKPESTALFRCPPFCDRARGGEAMKRGKTKRDLERAVVRAAVRWAELCLLEFDEERDLRCAVRAYLRATKKPRSKR